MVADMIPDQVKLGVCKAVDWEAKTMTATIDDLDEEDILLSIDGSDKDVKKPKVGTAVWVGIIENESDVQFMLRCEEFDLWLLNGEEFGGIPNFKALRKELEIERNRVDVIINVLNAAVAVPLDGGASMIVSIKAGLIALKTKGDYSKVESEVIKHG
jgi:hypothetical protein